jgi:POT family proton-dependent oligopeptide transporter
MTTKHAEKQPTALPVLFFTELWERFSYYGMVALLVLYMVSEMGQSDDFAYSIFATYVTLVYVTPLLGGFLSDRYLGCRYAIILGSLLMALGHFTLALPSDISFYLGLSLIIAGNGFFKPNITSLLGQLYKHGDPRRDSGYTIFYMAINIGSFFSPLICGFLGEFYGWHYGFGAAGVGMFIGLFTFLKFQYTIGDHGFPPNPAKLKKPRYGLTPPARITLGTLAAIPLFAYIILNASSMDKVMPYVGVVIFSSVLFLAFRSKESERRNILVILALMIFHTIFWAFMFQGANSINLFTSRNVDRMIGGFEIPTAWFQSLNPIFIVTLAPLFSMLWMRLRKTNRDPYPSAKFLLGLLFLSAGFGCLGIGALCINDAGRSPMSWLVLGYCIQTAGEVCISPVGLSMVSKLAPKRFASVFFGIWMLSISYASYLAGIIARLTSIPTGTSGEIDPIASAAIYGSIFTKISYASLLAAGVLLLLLPLLRTAFKKEEMLPKEELETLTTT